MCLIMINVDGNDDEDAHDDNKDDDDISYDDDDYGDDDGSGRARFWGDAYSVRK